MPARINPPQPCPDRTERLRDLINAGHHAAAIARIEGLARSTMCEVLQRHGLAARRKEAKGQSA